MDRLGFVTIPSAARHARKTVPTIYRWIERGMLKTITSGTRTYVTKDSLQATLGPLYSIPPG